MLTSQDVVVGYRILLGREPESGAVIDHHVKSSTLAALRDGLLSSQEFQERVKRDPALQEALAPATAVMNALKTREPARASRPAAATKGQADGVSAGLFRWAGQTRGKKRAT